VLAFTGKPNLIDDIIDQEFPLTNEFEELVGFKIFLKKSIFNEKNK